MAASASSTKDDSVLKGIRYALPRIIAKPISAVFSAYLGDLYIHTFEWRPDDFGLVTSIYSLARSISYMALGSIFYAIIDKKAQQNDKTALKTSRFIAAGSVALHASTFGYLIILPLLWHSTDKSMLDLFRMCLIRIWNLICRGRTTGRRYITLYESYEVIPKTLYKLPRIPPKPKPPPIGTVPFNNPTLDALLRFIRSKVFVIILFAVIHGIGLSSYELCNRAMPTYVEKDDTKLKTMTSINLGMYSSTYLLTIMIISLIKYFLHHVVSNANLFIGVSVFFMFFQFVICPTFLVLTQKDSVASNPQQPGGAKKCCCCQDGQCQKNSNCRCCTTEASESSTPNAKDWCQLFSMIILHGSINFWLSTPGPLAQYVATYIHGGNNTLKNFGPFILLGFDTLTAVSYTLYSIFGKAKDKCCCKKEGECASQPECRCDCTTGSTTNCCCKKSEITTTDKVLTYVSIAFQTIIYMLFYSFDYWWNKNSWFNFASFAICGTSFGLYLINTNNMQNTVVKKECFKKYKWIIIGSMLFFMYLTTSIASFAMYKVYDKDKVVNCACSCIRLACTYSFTGVYKGITFFFQMLNIIAASIYFFVP